MISPCIGICSIRGGMCRGCGRTPEQIQGWQEMTDEERREVMGQDNGFDVSPSWQELKEENEALKADERMAEWRNQRWSNRILQRECNRLESERDMLREDLSARFAQTKCGCGHPACNRCRDDAETQRVLGHCRP